MFTSLALASLLLVPGLPDEPQLTAGIWHGELESTGGPLPFGMKIDLDSKGSVVWLINGVEHIRVPDVRVTKGRLLINMPHYASKIVAEIGPDGDTLVGRWAKNGGKGKMTLMDFRAQAGERVRFDADEEGPMGSPVDVSGRWAVRFSSADNVAVGIFDVGPDGAASGTFLTDLGDYRYLAGTYDNGRLRLSCFDGAHAFLFDARLERDMLKGDFWSRDTWHETWVAERDDDVQLVDPFKLSTWKEDVEVDSLTFTDPKTGEDRALGEDEFQGKVRLIQIFGSWCPNCHDEAPFLAELHDDFHARGLQIVGIAFEHSGRLEVDAAQLDHFRQRHAIPYPMLLGGLSDKAKATESFRALERVIAYPTVAFVDAKGKVRLVHTGYAGPATGKAHERLKERYRDTSETLLAEAASKK